MSALQWDEHYARILIATREKSIDPSSKYAAVIVDHDHVALSSGYNGPPRGVEVPQQLLEERPRKYDWMIHAEENAIYNAAKKGIRLEGSLIYVIEPPCMRCCWAILQVGIVEVVYFNETPPVAFQDDGWRQKADTGRSTLVAQGIRLRRGLGTA